MSEGKEISADNGAITAGGSSAGGLGVSETPAPGVNEGRTSSRCPSDSSTESLTFAEAVLRLTQVSYDLALAAYGDPLDPRMTGPAQRLEQARQLAALESVSPAPCDFACPKCGGVDVHRCYRRQGERWDAADENTDPASKFVNKITSYRREAARECITHHCRTCQYNWQTSVIKKPKK